MSYIHCKDSNFSINVFGEDFSLSPNPTCNRKAQMFSELLQSDNFNAVQQIMEDPMTGFAMGVHSFSPK